MILKIAILILLIEIIAAPPPKGWPAGKPWPPPQPKPKPKQPCPKPVPIKDDIKQKQHNPCVCPGGPKSGPGGCVMKLDPGKGFGKGKGKEEYTKEKE